MSYRILVLSTGIAFSGKEKDKINVVHVGDLWRLRLVLTVRYYTPGSRYQVFDLCRSLVGGQNITKVLNKVHEVIPSEI